MVAKKAFQESYLQILATSINTSSSRLQCNTSCYQS